MEIIGELNLLQTTDEDAVQAWVDAVLQKMPDKVSEYRKGKKRTDGIICGRSKKDLERKSRSKAGERYAE